MMSEVCRLLKFEFGRHAILVRNYLVWIATLCSLLTYSAWSCDGLNSDEVQYIRAPAVEVAEVYDIWIGWFNAGTLYVTICTHEDTYQLHGSISTKGIFEKIIRWQGRFTSVGHFVDNLPQTDTYLVVEEQSKPGKRGGKKIVISDQESARTYRLGREDEIRMPPEGEDLMSTLMMLTHCRETLVVHDGEDPYNLELYDAKKNVSLRQRSQYFNGESTLCRYKMLYKKKQTRKLDIWVAKVGDRVVPVRIQARVPFLPDAYMSLRVSKPS